MAGDGNRGIPTGATAIVLNLTVVNANATTFMTLWPDGTSRPTTSNLDVLPGKTTSSIVRRRLEALTVAIDIANCRQVARTSSWTTSGITRP